MIMMMMTGTFFEFKGNCLILSKNFQFSHGSETQKYLEHGSPKMFWFFFWACYCTIFHNVKFVKL